MNITQIKLTEIEKQRYAFDESYKELFSNNAIAWYSDEVSHKIANYLKNKENN